MNKRMISMLLSVTVLLGTINVTAFAQEENTAAGENLQASAFGDIQTRTTTGPAITKEYTGLEASGSSTTISAIFYDDGLLEITGSGVMMGWEDYSAPWRMDNNNTKIKTVTVAAGITNIGENAFSDCKELKNITLPEGLESISNSAFRGCTALETANFPQGFKSIGENAFTNCNALETVNFPQGLKSIGKEAFSYCHKLRDVTLPKGLQTLGENAFRSCEALKTVTISEGLETIGTGAFKNCEALETVSLPEGLKALGDGAFQNCKALETINFPKSLETISDSAFRGCTALESITLPKGLKKIEAYTFYNCTALESITLPKGLEEIEGNAFYGCTALESVTLQGNTPPVLADTAFLNVNSNFKIHVPMGAETAYEGASEWSKFAGKIFGDYVPPTVTKVTVSPATASVQQGNTHQFTAVVIGTGDFSSDVIWEVDGTTPNAGTSIDEDGLLTVAADETDTTLTVTATSDEDNTVSGIATVTVPPTVTKVIVSPATASVQQGKTQQFTAVVEGANNPSQSVMWEVSGASTNVATSIDRNGLLTVAANEADTTLTVTATSVEDNTTFGTATVTVTKKGPATPTITAVTVSPATASVQQGGKQQFTAKVEGMNNPSQSVMWEVSGTSPNIGTSIDENGVLTVAANETDTTLTVTATSTVDTSKSATAIVTVTKKSDPTPPTGGGGGDDYSYSSTKTEPAKAPVITPAEAKIATEKAIAAKGKTAEAYFKNASAISPAAMNVVIDTAKRAGLTPWITADTVVGKAVTVRVSFDPTPLAKTTANVRLSGKIGNEKIDTLFAKHFTNEIEIVSLDQVGSFGTTVKVAAKVDLTKLNKNNLKFYSYDPKTNAYTALANTAYFVDTKGYVQFSTAMGGDILITDKAMTKR